MAGLRRHVPAIKAVCATAEAYEGLPPDVTKIRVLQMLKDAAPRLGLSHGIVLMIEEMVAATQPQDWTGAYPPVSWISNERLEIDLGRSRTQVQHYIRTAIAAGLIAPKDSPNGKRYGRRGDRGEIVEAYGFDLSPLAVRYEELEAISEAAKADLAETRRLRRTITCERRLVRQAAGDALERGCSGFDWRAAIVEASAQTARGTALEDLRRVAKSVRELLRAVDKAWLESREKEESEPKGPESRAHKRPTTNLPASEASYRACREEVAARAAIPSATDRDEEREEGEVLPLSLVLGAVPELHPYIEDPKTADWDEVVGAAYDALPDLGINHSAWVEARQAMGVRAAAVAVATILARRTDGEIRKSAGGYLRAMTERARTGELHLLRSLYGLVSRPKVAGDNLRRKRRAREDGWSG